MRPKIPLNENGGLGGMVANNNHQNPERGGASSQQCVDNLGLGPEISATAAAVENR